MVTGQFQRPLAKLKLLDELTEAGSLSMAGRQTMLPDSRSSGPAATSNADAFVLVVFCP